jgi:lysophospholipase L1-like esterase
MGTVTGLLLASALPLASAASGAARVRADGPLFREDFESGAARGRWLPYGGAAREDNALWSTNDGHGGQACLVVRPSEERRGGGWESPPFPVRQDRYYRVTFFSRSEGPSYAAAVFSDGSGAQTEGDYNWGVEPSDAWTERVFCFRGKFPASTASLTFCPRSGAPLFVDDIRVEPVGPADVLAWADGVYAGMPPLSQGSVGATRGLPERTLARLRARRTVKIVLLGDSIANDLSNAALDLLLQRAFPGARVDTVFVGRGGTGWVKYRHQVRERVAQHDPHLAVLLAVSNDSRYLDDDLRDVIACIRQQSPETEMLLVTPHLSHWMGKDEGLRHRDIQRRVAEEAQVPCLDLLQVWTDYVRVNGLLPAWLLRDAVHMNERGRQLSARAFVRYLLDGAPARPAAR